MKLSKRITILFSLAILLSIFIVSILSNQLINNNFDQYLLGEKSETVKQIGQEINEQYQEDDYKIDPDRIDSYASLEDLDINIVNLNDELLYTSRNQNRMHGMHGMPGGRSDHHEMMRERHRSNPSDQEMIEKTFDLLEGKEKVGSVSIAYIDDSIGSANALLFKETLSKILLLASVIAITIGLITSILLSKSLTKPLIKIKNTAQEIQKGHLAKKSDSKTNIIEIQELSDAINQLGQSLSEQEEIRKDYASDISHELRTPVATLKSHVEAIMDGVWEADQDHLDVLMKEIDRLSLLIDELKESFNSSTKNLVLNK
ncbi:MAG: HAMP domain-containing protein, partial [Atopostipes sp.]|nr:HAMP domain-containing protein [Atopostipes sp.]